MGILALDLGTKTGWAFATGAKLPDDKTADTAIMSGVWDLKGTRYDGGGMRFVRFRKCLNDVAFLGVTTVVFEEVRRHMGTDAAHVYGGLLAIVTEWCEVEQIPYQGVPVGTIKKFVTGKGNAGKPEVIAAVQSWGYTGVTDDNQADALALLHLALAEGL